MPDGFTSKVVAPRNPKLVKGEDKHIKLTPSVFIQEMALTTEQKLASIREMHPPRIIELLDMSETTHQKFTTVDIDQAMFQPFPSEIVFQNYTPCETYKVPLVLRNNDKIPRLVKVIQETSPYFQIISPLDVCNKVAPGMASTFNILFTPEENKDYLHKLVCVTEREKFAVAIRAIGARALLDFPDHLNFSTCPVKCLSQRTLLVRNIGNNEARFTLSTQSCSGHLKKYGVGEDIYISLYGAATDINVRLDKNSVIIEKTFLSLANQRAITISNRSDVIVHFQWKAFATHEEEDQQKLRFSSELQKEEDDDMDLFLAECSADPTLRERISVLSRTFQNRQRLLQDDQMIFSDDIFHIDLLEGDIWPNSTAEVNIVFKPKEAKVYQQTIYCDITGRETRLPLRVKGEGIGAKLLFNFDQLHMGNIFVGSKHSYEAILSNKGDIDAIFSLVPPSSALGSCFSFNPSKGVVLPGGYQAIEVSFSSSILGDFQEEFLFSIDGNPQNISVTFRGCVIGPTFHFNLPVLNFGDVSFGFPRTLTCCLHNTSLVPMTFYLRVPADGSGDTCVTSSAQVSDTNRTMWRGIDQALSPREFTVTPSTGTMLSQGLMDVQVTLCSNRVQRYEFALVVDVEGIGEEVLALPIVARCVVPPLRVVTPVLEFRRCFLNYPYHRTIQLANDDDLPACYGLLPQVYEENSALLYSSPQPRGIIEPHSTLEIPLVLQAALVGRLDAMAEVAVFGSEDPPLVRSNSHWRLEPSEGVVPPDGVTEIRLVANLDDTLRFQNKIHLVIENSQTHTIPVMATGTGTTIVTDRPFAPELNLGARFSSGSCQYHFKLTNMGRRCHQLYWMTNLKREHGPTNVLVPQYKSVLLKNVSSLPLNMQMTLEEPFSICDKQGDLSLSTSKSLMLSVGKEVELWVQFEPSYRKDCYSWVAEECLVFQYLEHPQKDYISLHGEVHFPNLHFSSMEVDFGCILNDTEVLRTVDMSNCSPLPVKYRWSFLVDDWENKIRCQEQGMFVQTEEKREEQGEETMRRGDDAITDSNREIEVPKLTFAYAEEEASEVEKTDAENERREGAGSPKDLLPCLGAHSLMREIFPSSPSVGNKWYSTMLKEAKISLERERWKEEAYSRPGTMTGDQSSEDYIASYDSLLQMEVERLLMKEHALEQEGLISSCSEDSNTSQQWRKKLPRCCLPEYTLDFGYVIHGNVSTHIVKVTNTGPLPVSFHADRRNLANNGFSTELDRVKNLPYCETETFEVRFDPRGANLNLGEIDALMPIQVLGGPTIHVRLLAVVTMPSLTVSTDKLEFGTVQCGQCQVMTVQLYNHLQVTCEWAVKEGEKTKKKIDKYIPLHLRHKARQELKAEPPVFEMLPPSGVLLPGERINVQVKFSPAEEKLYSQRLALCISQSSHRVMLLAQGKGLELRLDFSPTVLEFGPILPQNNGDDVDVLVKNPCAFPIEFYALEYDKQYLEEEKILRMIKGYDCHNIMLLPPRAPGEKLPSEILEYFEERRRTREEQPKQEGGSKKEEEDRSVPEQGERLDLTGAPSLEESDTQRPTDTQSEEEDVEMRVERAQASGNKWYSTMLKEAKISLERERWKEEAYSRPGTMTGDQSSEDYIASYDSLLQMEVERLLMKEHALEQEGLMSSCSEDSNTSQQWRKKLPRCCLPEYTLDFGYVIHGNVSTHIVKVTNTGPLPVSFHADRRNLANNGFSTELDRVKNLPYCETETFEVRFDPRGANLNLGEIDALMPIQVLGGPTIHVRLLAVVTMPSLTVSTDKLEFGTVQCGQCQVMTVQLYNHLQVTCEWAVKEGEKTKKKIDKYIPLHLRHKARQELKAEPPVFEMLPPSGVLLPGERINVQVKFSPAEEKLYSQHLALCISQSSHRVMLLAQGKGLELRLDFSPTVLEFGPILPQNNGDDVDVLVKNPCTFPIEFYALEYDKQYLEEEKLNLNPKDLGDAKLLATAVHVISIAVSPLFLYWLLGIVTNDIASIFEEHRICKNINLYQSLQTMDCGGIFVEDENKFLFNNVLVGRQVKARFKIINTGKVHCDLSVTVKPVSSKAAARITEVFEVEPTRMCVPSHSHSFAVVTFSPQTMQNYQCIFEAAVEGFTSSGSPTKTKSLMFDIAGDGNLPRVTVLRPSLRNKKGNPLLLFRRLLLGSSEKLLLLLKNDSNVPAQVNIDLLDEHGAFTLQAAPNTHCTYISQSSKEDDRIVSGRKAHTSSLVMSPGQSAEFVLLFSPSAVRLYKETLRLLVVDNKYEETVVQLLGEGYQDEITLDNIHKAGQTRDIPELLIDQDTEEANYSEHIYLGYCHIGRAYPETFTMTNHSNADAVRFEWPADSSQLKFSPQVGHLHSGCAKDITMTFRTETPVTLRAQLVKCKISKIAFQQPVDQVPDWDDRQRTVKWVDIGRQAATHRPAKKKVIETDPEPVHTVLENTARELPLQVSAVADYAQFQCKAETIRFKDTLLFQTRVFEFQMMNKGNVQLEFSWQVLMESYGKGVSFSEKHANLPEGQGNGTRPLSRSGSRPMSALESVSPLLTGDPDLPPFIVEPSIGVIAARKKQVFLIKFSPLDVAEFEGRLVCSIPNLKDDQGPTMAVKGRSLLPFCHFDIVDSDYISSNQRDPELRGPRGAPPRATLDSNTRVIEFFSVGLSTTITRTFDIMNPTNAAYSFQWRCDDPADLRLQPVLRCLTEKGTIRAGKKVENTFEFLPQQLDIAESFWTFLIPEHNIAVPFLLVGHAREPSVYLDRSYLNYRSLLIGLDAHETVYIVNSEETAFNFSFRETSRHSEGFQDSLTLQPMEGVVPPKSRVPVVISFNPTHEGKVNINLMCDVKGKTFPLTMNVKVDSYSMNASLQYEKTEGELTQFSQDKVNEINFQQGKTFPLTMNVKVDSYSMNASLQYEKTEGELTQFSQDKVNEINFQQVELNEKAHCNFLVSNTGKFILGFQWELWGPKELLRFLKVVPETGSVVVGQQTRSTLSFCPLQRCVLKDVGLKLKIRNGPTFNCTLAGSAVPPGVHFSFTKHNFGMNFLAGLVPCSQNLVITNKGEKEARGGDGGMVRDVPLAVHAAWVLPGARDLGALRVGHTVKRLIPLVNNSHVPLTFNLVVNPNQQALMDPKALEISLDQIYIPFGAVIMNSQASRRILMQNTGDIGAR
ncbi:UNVERIFIED_CONTAM: hypothetical protein FKN15_002207 [Acipenser sinensis]